MTEKWQPYNIALTPHEVEQLIAINEAGILPHGKVISRTAAAQLRDAGLICYIDLHWILDEGGWGLTDMGQKWIDVLRIDKRIIGHG